MTVLLEADRHECWPDGLAYGRVSMRGVVGHRQVQIVPAGTWREFVDALAERGTPALPAQREVRDSGVGVLDAVREGVGIGVVRDRARPSRGSLPDPGARPVSIHAAEHRWEWRPTRAPAARCHQRRPSAGAARRPQAPSPSSVCPDTARRRRDDLAAARADERDVPEVVPEDSLPVRAALPGIVPAGGPRLRVPGRAPALATVARGFDVPRAPVLDEQVRSNAVDVSSDALAVVGRLGDTIAGVAAPRLTTKSRIFRVEIVLADVEPTVRRVVELPGEASLAVLHEVVQASMGWADAHLHEFDVAGTCYGVPDPDGLTRTADESSTRLFRLLDVGDRAEYVYDFGDSWRHVLTVEAVGAPEVGVRYPRCVAARGACPPEDVGGFIGYAELVDALADPAHPEHAERAEWWGSDTLDPHHVDPVAADRALERLAWAPPAGSRA